MLASVDAPALVPFELHAAAAQGDVAAVLHVLQKQRAEELRLERRFGKTKAVDGQTQTLRRVVEINVLNAAGRAPIHVAASRGHKGVVKLLVEQGAIIDLADREGETAVLVAALGGHEGVLRTLLDLKANLQHRDPDGWTALHNAATNGHLAAARLLIGRGISVNAQSLKGQTPLMLAAGRGRVEMIKVLLENKADLYVRNYQDESAYDLAATNEYIDTCDALVEIAEKQGRIKDLASTTFIDIIYENQQSGLVGGYSPFTPLPWSDAAEEPAQRENAKLPDLQWFWLNEWKVDMHGTMDPNGWMYARDWKSPIWTDAPGLMSYVRRRRWLRVCKRKVQLKPVPQQQQGPVSQQLPSGEVDYQDEYILTFNERIANASKLEESGKLDQALDLFETAISSLIAGLRSEIDKQKRQFVKRKADAALERAERLSKTVSNNKKHNGSSSSSSSQSANDAGNRRQLMTAEHENTETTADPQANVDPQADETEEPLRSQPQEPEPQEPEPQEPEPQEPEPQAEPQEPEPQEPEPQAEPHVELEIQAVDTPAAQKREAAPMNEHDGDAWRVREALSLLGQAPVVPGQVAVVPGTDSIFVRARVTNEQRKLSSTLSTALASEPSSSLASASVVAEPSPSIDQPLESAAVNPDASPAGLMVAASLPSVTTTPLTEAPVPIISTPVDIPSIQRQQQQFSDPARPRSTTSTSSSAAASKLQSVQQLADAPTEELQRPRSSSSFIAILGSSAGSGGTGTSPGKRVLPKQQWAQDADVSECHQCDRQFSMLIRRHHCRFCGNIFCDDCSSREWQLDKRMRRVCDGCYDTLSSSTVGPLDGSRSLTPDTTGGGGGGSSARGGTSSVEPDDDCPDSALADCPKCGMSFHHLGTEFIEEHMSTCFMNVVSKSPMAMGGRYLVHRIVASADASNTTTTPTEGKECPICFEDFVIGHDIATLSCLCQYHKECIDKWRLRGKQGCPVHYQ